MPLVSNANDRIRYSVLLSIPLAVSGIILIPISAAFAVNSVNLLIVAASLCGGASKIKNIIRAIASSDQVNSFTAELSATSTASGMLLPLIAFSELINSLTEEISLIKS